MTIAKSNECRLPGEFAVSLCAYVRQAALSIHRANSLEELSAFYADRSRPPAVIRSTLAHHVAIACHQGARALLWPKLAANCQSRRFALAQFLKALWHWKVKGVVVLGVMEATALCSLLWDLERLLTPGQSIHLDQKLLRYRLSMFESRILARILHEQSRRALSCVDHLNSAERLQTIPIDSIPGWCWGKAGRQEDGL